MELPLREVVNLKYNMHRDSELCLEHAKGSVNMGRSIVTEAEDSATQRI